MARSGTGRTGQKDTPPVPRSWEGPEGPYSRRQRRLRTGRSAVHPGRARGPGRARPAPPPAGRIAPRSLPAPDPMEGPLTWRATGPAGCPGDRSGTRGCPPSEARRCLQRWGLRGRGRRRRRAPAPAPGRAPMAVSVTVAEPGCVPVTDHARRDRMVPFVRGGRAGRCRAVPPALGVLGTGTATRTGTGTETGTAAAAVVVAWGHRRGRARRAPLGESQRNAVVPARPREGPSHRTAPSGIGRELRMSPSKLAVKPGRATTSTSRRPRARRGAPRRPRNPRAIGPFGAPTGTCIRTPTPATVGVEGGRIAVCNRGSGTNGAGGGAR